MRSLVRHPLAVVTLAAAVIPVAIHAQVSVLTNRYDPQRTGANLSEATLTSSNVNVNQFGKLYSYPVDGAVFAQPLYVRGVAINGVSRNVLYVATMNDKVYAFDADSQSPAPLWTRNFTNPPSITAVPITDITGPNLNIIGNVGVVSTPVIDLASRTIYLVAKTKENGNYLQRLHAMDVATGAERPGSPVIIAGTVPGTGPDAIPGPDGPMVPFDPRTQNQRIGLALSNGVLLIAWGSHEDVFPYHGWIMSFDAQTLARIGIFAVTPDVYGGGVWQGGRAPTIDRSGYAYFTTGNGDWDGIRNFSDSLLKFRVNRDELTLVDSFTPSNELQLNLGDDDLSGSGFTLLPGTNLLLGGGKEGVLYLIDADNLGGKVANDTQIVQKLSVKGGHVMGGPVFWDSSAAGALVYNWAEDDVLKAYRLSSGRLVTTPFAQGLVISPGHPGGSLTLSANGSGANTGIIWASMPTLQDGLHGLVAGVLRAYNAETLSEIWSSEQKPARDRVGTLMKFVPPVVVDGRVYLPNYDNQVHVYGLLPPDFSLDVDPGSNVVAPGTSGTFSVAVRSINGFTGAVDLSAGGYPAGTTVAFAPSPVAVGSAATMTVTVPQNASGIFSLTVTGTSGDRSHSASPVFVNVTTASGSAGIIGIDFVGNSPTQMGPNEIAGVVPTSHWNVASGFARSTPLPLADETGATSAASVTWSASNTWATPITDQPGNARMMKGYLDTTNTSTTTVTVAGLATRAYDVYVYADGDNKTYTRKAAYTISGPGISTTTIALTDVPSTNFTSTFTEARNSAGNHVKFTINASGFTLTAAPTEPASGTRRAPVNGIQIVPAVATPPPSAVNISVNFVGTVPSLMAASDVAGVVAKSNWNNANGASRSTPLPLTDDTGGLTSATLTWTANNTWATPIVDQPGNIRMMKGYLDTSNSSVTTVTVAGLPSSTYDVYVYVDGDNRTFARTASYTIAGQGFTFTATVTDPGNTNFSGTFTEAVSSNGNYVRFRVGGSGFTITARSLTSGSTTLRAPINAIQIVAAQTP